MMFNIKFTTAILLVFLSCEPTMASLHRVNQIQQATEPITAPDKSQALLLVNQNTPTPAVACGPGRFWNVSNTACELCVAGSYQRSHVSVVEACSPCPGNKYSDVEGAASCSDCGSGMVSLEGATTCTPSTGFIAPWVFEGLFELLMTFTLLESMLTMTLSTDKGENRHKGNIVLIMFVVAIVAVLSLSIVLSIKNWDRSRPEYKGVVCAMFGIWVVMRGVGVGYMFYDYHKEHTDEGATKSQQMEYKWTQSFSDLKGTSLTIGSFLVMVVVLVRLFIPSVLARFDLVIVTALMLVIQMHVSVLVSRVEDTEGMFKQLPLRSAVFIMLFHAVIFPLTAVYRIMAHKLGTTDPEWGFQISNFHLAVDYFGFMTAGVAVALELLGKAKEASDAGLEKFAFFGTQAAQLTIHMNDVDCENRDTKTVIRHSNNMGLRVNSVLQASGMKDLECEFLDMLEPLESVSVDYSIFESCAAWKVPEGRVDSNPRTKCHYRVNVAHKLKNFLEGNIVDNKSKLIEVRDHFTMIVLLVDAYYGAAYNVFDLAGSDAINLELQHFYVLAALCLMAVVAYIIGTTVVYQATDKVHVKSTGTKWLTAPSITNDRCTFMVKNQCRDGTYVARQGSGFGECPRANSCHQCQPGTWKSGLGIACEKCAAGHYNPDFGSIDSSSCKACAPGSTSQPGAASCTDA